MDDNTRTVVKIKAQLSKFSGIISKGFSKAKQKLIKEIAADIEHKAVIEKRNIFSSFLLQK